MGLFVFVVCWFFFFFQAEDGIRDVERSRGLGDVYKRQVSTQSTWDPIMSAAPLRAQRPQWTLPRVAYQSPRGCFTTEHETRYGKYRERPRDRLPSEATAMPRCIEENVIGTTKTTKNIPGYTGLIPSSDLNWRAREHSSGTVTRTTFLKNNIVENFIRRVPGYTGHLPVSSLNDRGALRGACLSTAGEKFN
eukprot:TRINITY_DN26998_c0_g1_i2.p3 TRINITY_DN26998_c0_g1~~TRINITY_DN26998_c0_g1_i2.p3  ORF type:complete len:192 (-),score=35.30 TRINITY_DN26998_c0_g1_i2:64-639(-)